MSHAPENHNEQALFRNVSTSLNQINPPTPPPPSDISENRLGRLAPLQQALGEYLLQPDPDALSVLLGAVAAFQLDLPLVWLMLVGPPSSSKTEFVNLLDELPEAHFLSSLTEYTLLSGYDEDHTLRQVPTQHEDKSLLHKLSGKILLLKDFTTILSKRSESRKEILSQLREIYDGRYSKSWGTGVSIDWKGRVGLIAGVTDIIDSEHEVMAQLGPRFVFFRMQQADRLAVARRAMQNSQTDDAERRKALAKQVKAFMEELASTPPKASAEDFDWLDEAADLATRARSTVNRDGRDRDLTHTPEPEVPARFARQLLALCQGVAAVRGHDSVEPNDLRTVCRVALDAIPPRRRNVVDVLGRANRPLSGVEIAAAVSGSSQSTVNRSVEDLEALGVIEKVGSGWVLRHEYRRVTNSVSLRNKAVQ